MVNNVLFSRQIGMLWEVLLLGRVVVEEAEFSSLEATLNLAVVSSASNNISSHWSCPVKVEYIIGPHPGRGHSTCLLLDVLMDEPSWFPSVPVRISLGGPARRAREVCENCGGVVTGTCGVFFCGRQAGGSGGAATRSGRRPGGSGR